MARSREGPDRGLDKKLGPVSEISERKSVPGGMRGDLRVKSTPYLSPVTTDLSRTLRQPFSNNSLPYDLDKREGVFNLINE